MAMAFGNLSQTSAFPQINFEFVLLQIIWCCKAGEVEKNICHFARLIYHTQGVITAHGKNPVLVK